MKAPEARLVWLFDIDGTLLWTDGAAREAFSSALSDQFGLTRDLDGIAFGGRTDPMILADIVRAYGLTWGTGGEVTFWPRVHEHMERLLVPGRGRLLPGVERLLDRVSAEPGWIPALLTGNGREMARIKLDHFGLADRFAFGTYGDEGEDRNAIARLAVRRVEESTGLGADRCVVVGDTEHDIFCARQAGARVVAVATGAQSREALAAHAPDLLLDDLADPSALLSWAHEVTVGKS